MASIISAGTTSGTALNMSGDTSGILQLASNGTTTAITIDTSQRVAFVAGTAALPAITTDGDTNTGIWFPAADTIAFSEGGAEAMRITSGGFLCINATSTTYNESLRINTANQQGIHINDTTSSSSINYQYFTKGSGPTNVGAIYYNGSVMAYQTTSDYRLKENVAPITNALNKISLLKPVTYTWKDNQRSGEGFLAHELQEYFPDAVSGTKDEIDENGKPKYQGVDSSNLVPLLTAALQEAITRIEALEAKVG
jgi:hypothetical protein